MHFVWAKERKVPNELVANPDLPRVQTLSSSSGYPRLGRSKRGSAPNTRRSQHRVRIELALPFVSRVYNVIITAHAYPNAVDANKGSQATNPKPKVCKQRARRHESKDTNRIELAPRIRLVQNELVEHVEGTWGKSYDKVEQSHGEGIQSTQKHIEQARVNKGLGAGLVSAGSKRCGSARQSYGLV